MIIDREQDVAFAQDAGTWARCHHRGNEHAAIVVFESKKPSLRWVLQFDVAHRKIDIFVIVTVFDVLEEATDHGGRHHVSDALGDVAAITLKRYADDFGVLHHRAAAVARINLRADLNSEVLINGGVGVKLEVDPRDNPGRDRHAFTANRVTIGRDR